MERPGATTMKGNPLTLIGPELQAGDGVAVSDGRPDLDLALDGRARRGPGDPHRGWRIGHHDRHGIGDDRRAAGRGHDGEQRVGAVEARPGIPLGRVRNARHDPAEILAIELELQRGETGDIADHRKTRRMHRDMKKRSTQFFIGAFHQTGMIRAGHIQQCRATNAVLFCQTYGNFHFRFLA